MDPQHTALAVAWDAALEGHANKLADMPPAVFERQNEEGRCVLHAAAGLGHLQCVEVILRSTPHVMAMKDDTGCTPLYLAAAGGHDAVVSALAAAGADTAVLSAKRATPLFIAALEGRPSTVRLLAALDSRQVNTPDYLDMTPLLAVLQACRPQVADVVAALLEQPGVDTSRALHMALFQRRFDLAATVLRAPGGLDMTERMAGGDTMTALGLLATNTDSEPGLLRAVLAAGGDPATLQTDAQLPVASLAATHGHVNTVRLLVEEGGADVNQLCGGSTPLPPLAFAMASPDGDAGAAMVRLLLAAGADPRPHACSLLMVCARRGTVAALDAYTAATGMVVADEPSAPQSAVAAAAEGRWPVAARLLQAPLALPPDDAATVLSAAAAEPNAHNAAAAAAVATALLAPPCAVDPNVVAPSCAHGETPLYLACTCGPPAIATALLAAGADPNACTDLQTALSAAMMREPCEVGLVLALLAAGADANRSGAATRMPPLVMACRALRGADRHRVVARCLEQGADPNAALVPADRREPWSALATLLHFSARDADADAGCLSADEVASVKATCQALLAAGARPNAADDTRSPALEEACLAPPLQPVAVVLMAAGASPHGGALANAARVGNADLCGVLLAAGAGVDDRTAAGDGYTALMAAASCGHADVVGLLLRHGADLQALSSTGRTAACMACACGDRSLGLACLRALLAGGDVANPPPTATATPLGIASQVGDVAQVSELLAGGADVNMASGGRGPLELAVAAGSLAVASQLLAVDGCRVTVAATCAACDVDDGVVLLAVLLDAGAPVTSDTPRYPQPLAVAVRSSATCAQMLLASGAPTTPDLIMVAAEANNFEAIDVLLAAGADVNTVAPATGRTPLHAAVAASHASTAEYLTQHGAVLEAVDNDGWTPLVHAVHQGNLPLARELVAQGANVHVRLPDGRTLLHVATASTSTAVAAQEVMYGFDGPMVEWLRRELGDDALATPAAGLSDAAPAPDTTSEPAYDTFSSVDVDAYDVLDVDDAGMQACLADYAVLDVRDVGVDVDAGARYEVLDTSLAPAADTTVNPRPPMPDPAVAAGAGAGAGAGVEPSPPADAACTTPTTAPHSAAAPAAVGTDPPPPPAPTPPAPASGTPRSGSHDALGVSVLSPSWNTKFVSVLEDTCIDAESAAKLQAKIEALQAQFTDHCVPLVRQLVLDKSRPEADRMYTAAAVGGVAGGSKFVLDGVFFKFNEEAVQLYGTPEYAAKAAGHELKMCQQVLSAGAASLFTPLITVIDYHGFRVTAQTQVPGPGGGELLYGSNNAGATVHSDPRMVVLADVVASHLNLKPHVVGQSCQATLSLAVDTEGRLGLDGRRYLLDLARLMPPTADMDAHTTLAAVVPADSTTSTALVPVRVGRVATSDGGAPEPAALSQLAHLLHTTAERVRVVRWGSPPLVVCVHDDAAPRNTAVSAAVDADVHGTAVVIPLLPPRAPHLHCMLRPEVVRRHPVPLSSDAFTPFGRHNAEVHNAEVQAATAHMLTTCVPAAAAALDATALEGAADPAGGPTGGDTGGDADGDGAASLRSSVLDMSALSDASVELQRLLAVKPCVQRAGVNLRYLGHVRAACRQPLAKQWLLLEMLARVLRRVAAAALRRTVELDETARRETVVAALNAVLELSPPPASSTPPPAAPPATAASPCVEQWLWQSFPGALDATELKPGTVAAVWRACHPNDRAAVFDRMAALCGVTLWRRQQSPSTPLTVADIAAITPRPKRVATLPLATLNTSDADALDTRVAALREELATRGVALGQDHPGLLPLAHNLATLLELRDTTYTAATPLRLRAVAVRRAVLQRLPPDDNPVRRMATQLLFVALLRAADHLMGSDNGGAEVMARSAVHLAQTASGYGRTSPAAVSALMALGLVMACDDVRLVEAYRVLQQAAAVAELPLKLAKRLGNDPDASDVLQYSTAVERVAKVAALQGNHAHAKDLLVTVVQARRRASRRKTSSYFGALCELATAESTLGHPAAAVRMLRQALPEVVAACGPASQLTWRFRCALGCAHQQLEDMDAAEEQFRAAVELVQQVHGPESHQLVAPLLCLADLRRQRGDVAEALDVVTRAIDIRTAAEGDDAASLTPLLDQHAAILVDCGRMDEALALYDAVVDRNRRFLGNDHPSVAQALAAQAVVYRRTGRLDDSLAAYTESLAVSARSLGEGHVEHLMTCMNLVLLHTSRGDFGEAEAQAGRTVAAIRRSLGVEHPLYHRALRNHALTMERLGDTAGCIDALMRCLHTCDQLYGLQHPACQRLLRDLATRGALDDE